MPKFQVRSYSFQKIILFIVWGIFIAFLIALSLTVRWYNDNTKPVNRNRQDSQVFTVVKGNTWHEVAGKLQQEELIKNATALQWYVRLNNISNVHPGKFELSPAMSVEKVVEILTSTVQANVNVTIYPEHNLRQIQESLVEQGFKRLDVQEALQSENYADHPVVRQFIPHRMSLEGYLMPETFAVNQFNTETASSVLRRSLDTFMDNLTPEIEQGILENFNSVHEGVILASIVELEAKPEYRAQVAQVFITRLHTNQLLGSDVTTIYGAELENRTPSVNDESLYNTRRHLGLPPGPISNVSLSSLEAVAFPADGNYVFFLVGDDGEMYFNHTYQEHLDDIANHCQQNCRPLSETN